MKHYLITITARQNDGETKVETTTIHEPMLASWLEERISSMSYGLCRIVSISVQVL